MEACVSNLPVHAPTRSPAAGRIVLRLTGLLAALVMFSAGAHAATGFDADRASILAMTGNFKVTFDLRETTPWKSDYKPIKPVLSGGEESVRVAQDDGRHIVLQHLLVVKDGTGKSIVVKHWRQDWAYEPESLLVYAGQGRWDVTAVPSAERTGRWSQTVWQTDDSPRYGGIGRWTEQGGVRRWESNQTWRPLARRDAVRHPVYDRYLSINRHAPSPAGWIQWEDNTKMGPADGKLIPFVQEIGLNSYVRSEDFDVAAADAYWNATKEYWAAIRASWAEMIARKQGISVEEVADTGSASGERLMALADDIQDGKTSTADAIRRGRALIADVTAK